MVEDLVNCLAEYKAKMEYQSLDFDADRPQQIKEVRMEMAKKYENGEFGLVTVTPPKKPLTEMSVDEKIVYLKNKKMENGQIQKGHQRVQEKIKEVRQGFAKAVTVGTRSGSGKIVFEFYDKLRESWRGGHLPQSHSLLGWKQGTLCQQLNQSKRQQMLRLKKMLKS